MDVTSFIGDRIGAAAAGVLACVRPLATADQYGDLVPAGSGTLIWHRGQRYLLSAAHVLDSFINGPLLVGAATKWHSVGGEFRSTNPPRGRPREEDSLDYGFLSIQDDDLRELDGCHFLTADQLAINDVPVFSGARSSKYLVVGFPLNRFNYKPQLQRTDPDSLGLVASIASEATHKRCNRPSMTHVVLGFDRKSVNSKKGSHQAPRLRGLSGGAVFALPSLQNVGTVAPPRLAAIVTDFWPERDVVIGIRIAVVLQMLDAAA